MSNPEIPPLPEPDGQFPTIDDRAVRRAMRRGVLRTGLVAAVGLTVLAMLVVATAAVISTVRGPRFHLIAVNGMVVAHPEYEIWQDGSCCASGPLFGLTNLGLVNQVRLGLRPLGSLDHSGTISVTVEQSAGGDLHTNLDAGPTPLGDALARGRPSTASTAQFLRELPEPTVVSALIELNRPVDEPAFLQFFDRSVPVTAVSYRSVTVFAVDPYGPRSTNPVSWHSPGLDELRAWAGQLGAADDGNLAAIGLPPAAEIQRIAADGEIHAFVVPRMPLALARALLDDPSVRSLNVLDVAFDPARQNR